MSPASHHAEWLQLVPHTGPFLTLPVLQRVFPQQLEALDSGLRGHLRDALDDWREQPANPALHRAWILHVLKAALRHTDEVLVEGQSIPPGLEARQLEHGEVLWPDFVLLNPAGHPEPRKPRLLLCVYPPGTDLDKPLPDRRWKASPSSRMAELCHAANVPLGLVTNGDHWLLVWAPRGETTGYASWFAQLWSEEPLTFRAFISLLRASRFFAVAPGDTIEALYTESSRDQSEVTDQLGLQVRQAVQVLIQSLDRLDATHGRTLLAGTSEKELYNAALTVMMRLVFLFCAEEKGLLLLGNHLYDEHYAVSTLREQLRETADRHGEELLESRHDAWCRLLALFRAIHGGIEHDELRLPAYGGSLFDPDRYPFLEGRAADTKWQSTTAHPLEINNRVVLHLLEALQTLETKLPGTSERQRLRLSFRALDIEQIGHVYEGLLDHTAKRARELVLGLGGKKGEEPEIPLEKLEELAGGRALDPSEGSSTPEPFLLAADAPADVVRFPSKKGQTSYSPPERLVEFLHEATGRSKSALKKALMDRSRVDEGKLRIACGNDDLLVARVTPFAGLLREDTFGRPLVFPGGSLYVTSGSDRRSTGTHYTPRSLTEPIVQHTLEPQVYVGPAEGLPKEQWKLKPAKELLALKVCDMAMGSGAFLAQTCRYLAERLVEAWEQAEKAQPGAFITTPEGDLSSGAVSERLLPADPAERLAIARRYVADRCLYGVDINPMAVEMAKLSLWLITLQRDRPFTFLDHALKCGDSLLGVSKLEQIQNFSLRPDVRQMTFATANLFRYVEEAGNKRRELEDLPSNDHAQIETKNRLHAEAEAATTKVKALADCLIALELRGHKGRAYETARRDEAELIQHLLQRDYGPVGQHLRTHALTQLRGRRTFHWPIEFPEVFQRGGFDAFVANPPFIGNKYWSSRLMDGFDIWAELMLGRKPGKADVVALFFRRVHQLLRPARTAGLIATTTAREGATLEIGFEWLHSHGELYRAISQMAWPGEAGIHICVVWLRTSKSNQEFLLDGQRVLHIPPSLVGLSTGGKPLDLTAGLWVFQGSDNSQGAGFIINPSSKWFERLQKAKSPFLRPYLSGQDITDGTYTEPPRWCVDCEDLSWDAVKMRCPETAAFLIEVAQPTRSAEVLAPYFGLFERWWQMWNPRAPLYRELRKDERCLGLAMVSVHVALVELPTSFVFTNKICVIRWESTTQHAVLMSSFFERWLIEHSGTMGAGRVKVVLPVVRSFPLPEASNEAVSGCGSTLISFRNNLLAANDIGLTDLYNRFNSRTDTTVEIKRMRAMQIALDQAVAAAYGWHDMDLGHGFHPTKQGERYTLSESARRTVLDRLLALNHQRYEEELRAGLHDTNKPKPHKSKAAKTAAGIHPTHPDLLPPEQPELF